MQDELTDEQILDVMRLTQTETALDNYRVILKDLLDHGLIGRIDQSPWVEVTPLGFRKHLELCLDVLMSDIG